MERNHIINDVDFNYIEQQLQQGVSKIKLLDGSIDLEATKQQLIAYYTEKYKDLSKRFDSERGCESAGFSG